MAVKLLQWNESYSVGVGEIDAQHRKLFELFNSLTKAVDDGYEEDVIGHVLIEMSGYADEHFKSEQLYLERHPQYQEHFLEHWEFTKKCMGLVMAFRKDSSVSMETIDFLKDWLEHHLMEQDVRFFRELAEQGHL